MRARWCWSASAARLRPPTPSATPRAPPPGSSTGVDAIDLLPVADAAEAIAVLEGAGIGAYAYTGYRVATLGTTKTPAGDIVVHLPDGLSLDDDQAVARATAVVAAVHTVRDLVSTPASDLYPETLAAAAVDLATDLPIDVEVLDETALADGGYGGILGVGAGSDRPPRMVTLRYAPAGASSTCPWSARASRSTPAACR